MAETQSITLTQEQFDALVKAAQGGGSTAGMTPELLARAFAQAQKRENESAPMISWTNPRGERDHPRPLLRAKTYLNGIEVDHDTLLWEEVEALNVLPAGEFKVTKSNGSQILFTVRITRGIDGEKIDRVELHFPSKDDQKYDHRPLLEYCLEILEKAGLKDDVSRIKGLKVYLDGLRQKVMT